MDWSNEVMEKYKVLLAGQNRLAINDFFTHMESSFECQTTSTIPEDVASHLKHFIPDIFVFCMQGEGTDQMTSVNFSIKKIAAQSIPVVLFASQEDTALFKQQTGYDPALILYRPQSWARLETRIYDFIEERHQVSKAPVNSMAIAPVKPISNRKHILIVDDDAGTLRLLKNQLRGSYDVATAISGGVAMKFLETKHTDLILLDYEMPGEDGLTVFRKIRSFDALMDIPIVFLTGVSDRDKIQDVLVLKPEGYLLKPIEREKLLATIKRIIG